MASFRYVLETVVRLVAPFAPFVAEAAWAEIGKTGSVHLVDFPERKEWNAKLISAMERTREVAATGHAKRAKDGIKIRQPLMSFTSATLQKNLEDLRLSQGDIDAIKKVLAEELNVRKITSGSEDVLDTTLTEELRLEGEVRELIRKIQDARKKSGLKPGEEIVLTVGDAESKKLLEHPMHGRAICEKTSVKQWEYKPDASLSVTVSAT